LYAQVCNEMYSKENGFTVSYWNEAPNEFDSSDIIMVRLKERNLSEKGRQAG